MFSGEGGWVVFVFVLGLGLVFLYCVWVVDWLWVVCFLVLLCGYVLVLD